MLQIKLDIILHIVFTFLICLTGSMVLRKYSRIITPFFFGALGIGILKEFLDLITKGLFSFEDLFFDCIGAIIYFVVLEFGEFIKPNKAKITIRVTFVILLLYLFQNYFIHHFKTSYI